MEIQNSRQTNPAQGDVPQALKNPITRYVDRRPDAISTRRRIIAKGAKLLYAAPLVVASVTFTTGNADAISGGVRPSDDDTESDSHGS